jgi:hypothetical protein
MADSRPLLQRLLSTPDLARVVPRLQPDVLLRIIERCGLDDSAELVAMATPAQLARVFDTDLWRAGTPGGNDALDVERFGQWLEVLVEAGVDVAARTVAGLDIELVVAGLARHVAVFDVGAVSEFTTLDGEQSRHRAPRGERVASVGGYHVEARRASAWDAVVALLECLAAGDREYFGMLMRKCMRLSSAAREVDWSAPLLQDRDQQLHDLAYDRETRRAQEGYVAPGEAAAFLQASRELRLDAGAPPPDPLWRAHHLELASPADDAAGREGEKTSAPISAEDHGSPPDEPGARVMDVLRDAGVLTDGPKALLGASDEIVESPTLVAKHVELHPGGAEALAFLANALLAACSVQGRPLTPSEARDAALATCNLGLEQWPLHWAHPDLVTAFQVGWTILYRDVCLYAARRLLAVLAGFTCSDRDLRIQLVSLEHSLARHVQDGAPWRGQDALDAILALDAPSWAALVGMIGSCPVVHAAARARLGSARGIDPARFEFVARGEQLEAVREFLSELPSRLTG